MKKMILFDIDYTLFDTGIFREKLYKAINNALQSLGIDPKTLVKVQQEALQEIRKEAGYFHPKQFSLILSKKLKQEKTQAIIANAIFDKVNFKDNYYNEVRDVFDKLSHLVRIGIFSKGHSRFQREKLYDIKHLFLTKDIHISTNKYTMLPKVIKKYEDYKLYIVDDALDVLYRAKKISKKVFTIWVKRGIYAQKQEPIKDFVPDASIDNLRDLIPIVIPGK